RPPTYPLSLHDALPISGAGRARAFPRQPEEGGQPALRRGREAAGAGGLRDRGPDLEDELPARAGRGREGEAIPSGVGGGREPHRSEEHTSELQSPYDRL